MRDAFLSHSSMDKEFVRFLASDIEQESFKSRKLSAWVDEAEINPGQSIPGIVNDGLESSRFFVIVMTPNYFESGSGWTDAEWHSAIHADPDNRKGKILPILAADCPYIPALLRHLLALDMRGTKYGQGLRKLLSILKNEPLPRPISHRGSLVAANGNYSRESIIADRSVPEALPDVITENLHCNLLPITKLPKNIYYSPIRKEHLRTGKKTSPSIPDKATIIDLIHIFQEKYSYTRFTPVFRLYKEGILTFHDLHEPENPFFDIVEEDLVEEFSTTDFLRDENERNYVTSLLNMAISRHMKKVGLEIDDGKRGRYFFPALGGKENVITWTPFKNKTNRRVAKPCLDKEGNISFWIHHGAYVNCLFLANNYFVQIEPTWVVSDDGLHPKGGPSVGKIIIKWTGAERNLSLLYHTRFWSAILNRNEKGSIIIRSGDQATEVSSAPAFVTQSYGIIDDQKGISVLDDVAPKISEEEELATDALVEMEDGDPSISLDDEFEDESNVSTNTEGFEK